ncbi:hypothetical protein AAGS61_17805 [Lysinibacillus sp. KU-BSD001]|uniref:DUF7669 domain-containing protein n=1 Tax=Lysinibacillus sp. KU-BSD001 TaxID=3141328 RepID=UPI0036E3CDBF
MKATTCREQILTAAEQITQSKNLNEFTILDVLNYLTHQNTPYKESTIRTHITSKMCSNAPNHHAVTYNDLTRIKPGVYSLNK